MKILVLWNHSSDADDSHVGEGAVPAHVAAVVEGLRRAGLAAVEIDLEDDCTRLIDALVVEQPAVVFNLVDHVEGDRALHAAVAGCLDLLWVTYTGSAPLCLALCQDRARSRALLASAGVPVPRAADAGALSWDEPGDDPGDDDAHAPRGREHRRVSATVLGDGALDVLPLVERRASDARWRPARIDAAAADRIREVARRAFQVLGCRDVAHVELCLEGKEAYVLDVSPVVDIRPGSALRAAAARVPGGLDGIIAAIAGFALARARPDAEEPAAAASPDAEQAEHTGAS